MTVAMIEEFLCAITRRKQKMRNVVFAINITVDGCCGHESVIADDELHEYYTGTMS
jgi:hypothetical protein